MKCECGSERILDISAKTSDRCVIRAGEREQHGYVPYGVGIGGGDYLEFNYCLDCGRIQGDFPVTADPFEDN